MAARQQDGNETRDEHSSQELLERGLVDAIRRYLDGTVAFINHDGSFQDTADDAFSAIGLDTGKRHVDSLYHFPGMYRELADLILAGYDFDNLVVSFRQDGTCQSYVLSSRAIMTGAKKNFLGASVLFRRHDSNQYHAKNPFATNASGKPDLCTFGEIIGKDAMFSRAKSRATLLAPTSKRVVLSGETGTGKDLFAEAIHVASGRTGAFIKINCAAVTMEHAARFFLGFYENGTYHPGVLSQATEGTLYLDEVNALGPEIQSLIMQVLDEDRLFPVNSSIPEKFSARLVSSCSKNIDELLKVGLMSSDMYYRLAQETIVIPPLRQRRCDISSLTHHFIVECCQENRRRGVSLSNDAINAFYTYQWPGNVRELKSRVSNVCRLCKDGTVQVHDLPLHMLQTMQEPRKQPEKADASLKGNEYQQILSALAESNYNVAEAARILGMSKTTLYRRIKLFDIVLP